MPRRTNPRRMSQIKDFTSHHNQCNHTPSELAAVGRIIAIGDIHGDIDALRASLNRANVINKRGEWIGGDSIVVQVGDVLDRGGRGNSTQTDESLEELQIFHTLYDLNTQAMNDGGRVISLIGNHELMNLIGDFRYVANTHLQGMGGYDGRKQLFKPGGPLAKKMACNSLGIVKIGSWIFVHGGLLPEHIMQTLRGEILENSSSRSPLHTINTLVRNILNGTTKLDSISPAQEDLLFGRDGVFWTREFSEGNLSNATCERVSQSLKLLHIDTQQAGGIVMGHTPQQQINSQCDGRVWRIDTAMSHAFGPKDDPTSRVEILEILDNGRQINIL